MALDDHIINVDFDIPSDLVCEDLIHQALVRCSSVLNAKCNFLVAERATIGMEHCLIFIFPMHLDFVVAFIGVKETLSWEPSRDSSFWSLSRRGVMVFRHALFRLE